MGRAPPMPRELTAVYLEMIREIRQSMCAGFQGPEQPADALLEASRAIHGVSYAADQIPESEQRKWACQSGCNSCCYLMVAVSAVEVLRLVARIPELLGAEGTKSLISNLERRLIRSRPLSTEALVETPMPCALLSEDGSCSVYAERPVICRGYYSFNRYACDDEDVPVVPTDNRVLMMADGTRAGLRLACGDAGLGSRAYELNEALHRALTTDDALDRWLNGEDIFAGCREITESTGAARAHFRELEQRTR